MQHCNGTQHVNTENYNNSTIRVFYGRAVSHTDRTVTDSVFGATNDSLRCGLEN